jgi:hypothetical protein
MGLAKVVVSDLNPNWLKALLIQDPKAEEAWAVFYAGRVYGVHASLSAAYNQLKKIEQGLVSDKEPELQDTISAAIKAKLDSVKDAASSIKSKTKNRP